MNEASQPAEAEQAAPPKSKKKLFIALGVLVLVLGGGGAGAWYFMGMNDGTGEQAKEEPPRPPVYLPLETFTVNLQGGQQYLQVDLTLQLADPAQTETIKLHMPRVRSRLLSLLASKQADELVTPEDKQKLTREILAQVNQPFDSKGKPQQVLDVLYTSFVIQ